MQKYDGISYTINNKQDYRAHSSAFCIEGFKTLRIFTYVYSSNFLDFCKSPKSILQKARIPLEDILYGVTVYYAKSIPFRRIKSNDATHWLPTIEAWAGGSCYTLLTSHFNQEHPIAQINFGFKTA